MIFASLEITDMIAYALMAVGFIILVWAIKNLNKKSNARVIMIVGAVMVFGGVVASLLSSNSNTAVKRFDNNARKLLAAKAEKAASYVADHFPESGSAAFLIDETSYGDSSSDNYIVLNELRKRLADRGVSCDEVIIVGESKVVVDKKTGEETTENENPTDAAVMKKKLDPFFDKVDIVINFVGLPESVADLKKITFLTKKNTATGKNNMLLLCDIGLPYVEQDMLRKSRVAAIIDYVSGAGENFDIRTDSVPKDPSAAFDLIYFFVNADTLDGFISDNPNYFVTK